MNFRSVLTMLATVFFLVSCGSQSRVITTKKEQEQQKNTRVGYGTVQQSPVPPSPPETATEPEVTVSSGYAKTVIKYIDLYSATAKYEMKEHGIPASITLAQAILESGAGTSDIAARANNHFGIKCASGWEGEKVMHKGECFRSYDNPRSSFGDHSLFLQRSHYRSLFSLPKDDYVSWAKGLQRAGYATDKKYPEKLINIIERYQLYKYDREVLSTLQSEKPVTQTPAEQESTTDPSVPTSYSDIVAQYIEWYQATAKHEMEAYGIPASITLAQAILESGAGTSEVAVRAKNHFGIKCNAEWEGEKFYRDNECFRSYENARLSFRDHSLFLQRPHYRALFSLSKDDYKGWAKGLKEAGYASDSTYPEKLINLIERYQLHKYDREVLAAGSQETPSTPSPVEERYVVKPGDTLYSISRLYGITVEELMRMNSLERTNIDVGQVLIVKRPK